MSHQFLSSWRTYNSLNETSSPPTDSTLHLRNAATSYCIIYARTSANTMHTSCQPHFFLTPTVQHQCGKNFSQQCGLNQHCSKSTCKADTFQIITIGSTAGNSTPAKVGHFIWTQDADVLSHSASKDSHVLTFRSKKTL